MAGGWPTESTCAWSMRIMLVMLVVRAIFDVWTLFVTSSTIAEAHRFETWKGLVTVAMVAALPIVIGLAAFLASR